MKSRKFLIPSLVLAGFVTPREAMASLGDDDGKKNAQDAMFNLLESSQTTLVSGHASHSSHSSHASHASGSTSGGYTAPLYDPAPALRPYVAPAPPSQSVTTISPTPLLTQPADQPLSELVTLVQKALVTLGYYKGDITGVVDSATQTALLAYQKDWNLQQTGTVTPEVMAALHIGS